jgi:hypothetical protein
VKYGSFDFLWTSGKRHWLWETKMERRTFMISPQLISVMLNQQFSVTKNVRRLSARQLYQGMAKFLSASVTTQAFGGGTFAKITAMMKQTKRMTPNK